MKVDEIKVLLKSGDIAGAEAAAKAGLENDKDNFRLLMLYGTCRQLLGDEATFRDTYATVKAALDGKEVNLDGLTVGEWNRFEQLYQHLDQPELLRKGEPPHRVLKVEYVVLAVLIAFFAVSVAACWFGKATAEQMDLASRAMTGPSSVALYAGPVRENLNKNGVESALEFREDGKNR